jgi:GNAT superfamily N-acetyltransferase
MDINHILEQFDQQQRIAIELPGVRKEVFPNLVRFIRPAPGMNFVGYSRLDEATLDATIAEQIAYFAPMNQPFEWVVYDHDQPPILKERLVAHGFAPDEPAALMALDLHAPPHALLEPTMVDLRRLTHRDQLEDVIAIEQQVWGGNFGWMRRRMGDHMEIPGYLSIFVAYVERQPACVGWTYFHPRSQFAGLWGGSTLPKYRKRGLYTAVLAARVQEAIGRGYRFLTIEASPMSRPIVASHGFQLLTMTSSYGWEGSGGDKEIRR